ncbi:MAG TPA: hypothetical protein VF598_09895 [Hymenobacter sp.]|jgi:squalene cyclase
MRLATRRDWLPVIVAVVVLLLVLVTSLAASAVDLEPPRYSYREARRTERRYKRVVRYYKRQNRRDLNDLRHEYAQHQRLLRNNKKHEKSLIKSIL